MDRRDPFLGRVRADHRDPGHAGGHDLRGHAIALAGEVQANLVWSGINIALRSSAIGMVILVLASLAWFGLQLRWRLLAARISDGTAAGRSA